MIESGHPLAKAHFEMDCVLSELEDGCDLLVRCGDLFDRTEGYPVKPHEMRFLFDMLKAHSEIVREHMDALGMQVRNVMAEDEQRKKAEAELAARKPAQVFTLRLVGGDGEPAS